MSEKEIRAKIEQVCDSLDQRARSAARAGARTALFPFLLGAGLVTVACDGDVGGVVSLYDAPGGYPSSSSTGTGGDGGGGGASTGGGGSGAATGGGGSATGGSGGATGGGGAGADGGAAMEYMAPDP